MAKEKQKTIVACYILLLVLVTSTTHALDLKPKGTVKTIESVDDGDVVDCVDIYSQPAFDNPLINHIQMRPSSYPSGMKPEASLPELIQVWHKNGEECPEGTIPIIRAPNHDLQQHHRKFPFPFHGTQLNHSILREDFIHEYATVHAQRNVYYGSYASINVWNPKTEKGEFSLSQIWILSRTGAMTNRNTIEAGWMVSPLIFGDNRTRFFIYWTRDNYQNTGCYNLQCSGFVQTSKKFAVGSQLKAVSTYKGKTFDISLIIYRDKNTRNWWLQLQGNFIGYWPASIFTDPGLANSATGLIWGGEIINARSGGHHTTTQMGSGHFSGEGYQKASLFRNIGVIDGSNTRRSPGHLEPSMTNPACYDVRISENKQTDFYYGGPGYSKTCP